MCCFFRVPVFQTVGQFLKNQITTNAMESQHDGTSSDAQYIELEPAHSASLLDQILGAAGASVSSIVSTVSSATPAGKSAGGSPLSWNELLQRWATGLRRRDESLAKVRFKLSRDIGRIDALLEAQVNAILHHPEFQALESQWRGLDILCRRAAELQRDVDVDAGVVGAKIRILSVTKRELLKDFDRANEFDQNSLFKKIYEAEFGTAGGTPYGVLLANFEFTNHPNDIDLLERIAGVGAASFCPVVTSASPSMLGVEDLSKLEQPIDLEKVFQHSRYRKWFSLRKHPDAQFLGVTLPRVLMRLPYDDDGAHIHGFRFREDVEGKTQSNYLWGPSSWAFGCVLLRAFMQSGWFADIRGMERGVDGGGLVNEFPVHSFGTDQSMAANKMCVDVAISDQLESELGRAGFIPLCDCKDSSFSVFYSNQSVHEPDVYDDPVMTMNARVSAMFQYVLCCSRVAHFLRIEARNKIGSMQGAREIQNYLNRWITQYVTPNVNAPPELKARYPLQQAEVVVEELPGRPGEFRLTMQLLPHYQLDSLSSTMTLTARRVTGIGAR